ncbi:MAG TPA: gliding motility lipoprotein GldH [Bacteroidales bacterium]|nr:gliding motility lipoprotein GldH [Bacteroidales bacterium]
MKHTSIRRRINAKYSAIFFTAAVVSLSLLLMACRKNHIIDEFRSKDTETWNAADTLHFPFTITDTTSEYRLIIGLRNTTNYPYSNMFIFMNTLTPHGIIRRDTLEFLLADKYGDWLGKGIGRVRDSRFLINDRMAFRNSGQWNIILEHGMRDIELQGISDVGLRLEKRSN